MRELKPDECRSLALGELVKGYFHNIRGILQNLVLRVETILYSSKYPKEFKEDLCEVLNFATILNEYLDAALNDITDDSRGPWNLKKLLLQELLFWQSNLYFKHKVKKTVSAEGDLWVEAPISLLKGIFCLIGKELFSALPEGTNLKMCLKDGEVSFHWDKDVDQSVVESLKVLNSFRELEEVRISSRELRIRFKMPSSR